MKKTNKICQTCSGTGGEEIAIDPSDTVSESWVDCPDCLAKGLCPLCGAPVEGDDDYTECTKCSWDTENWGGMVDPNHDI